MENEEKTEDIASTTDENENENSTNESEDNTTNENQEEEKKEEKKDLTPFEKQLLGRIKTLEEKSKTQVQPQKAGETNQEFESRLSNLEFATTGEVSETVAKAIKEHKAVYKDKTYKEIKEMSFIQNMIKEEAEAKDLDDASISPEGGNTEQIKKNFKGVSLAEFEKQYDMTTEEGNTAFEKWEKDNGKVK